MPQGASLGATLKAEFTHFIQMMAPSPANPPFCMNNRGLIVTHMA